MIFTCPSCHKQHRLPEGVTLPPESATHCKKCGLRFLLNRAGGDRLAQSPPPIMQPEQKVAEEEIFPPVDQQAADRPAGAILDAFPELQELPAKTFLLDEIFVSYTHSRHQASQNTLLTKLISATAPLLSEKILQKGELVYRIASGIAYFPFEILYANGLLTWPMNYYALMCTDRRLIFINLDYHLSQPNRYVFQVPYDNVAGVSRGLYGNSLIITTTTGKKWDFTTVNRGLATSMEKFIREKSGGFAAVSAETLAPPQLCPACYQSVPKKAASCPHCLVQYKSSGTAMKKSLLLPGSGNIYLGNQYLGIIEMIGYLFTWMMTIVLVIIGIPGGIVGGGLLVIAYHLLAAYMAGGMAGKGNILVEDYPDKITLSSGVVLKFLKKPW